MNKVKPLPTPSIVQSRGYWYECSCGCGRKFLHIERL